MLSGVACRTAQPARRPARASDISEHHRTAPVLLDGCIERPILAATQCHGLDRHQSLASPARPMMITQMATMQFRSRAEAFSRPGRRRAWG
jgi:hypothetical protein